MFACHVYALLSARSLGIHSCTHPLDKGIPMTNAIVHFEIPADDVGRAQRFYKQAFGWKISDPWKMNYFFVETRKKGEEGINGGLMQRKMPGRPFMNYIAVKSIDASLKIF